MSRFASPASLPILPVRKYLQTHINTLELTITFFKNTQKITLIGPIKNQFERATLSIALNLAAGSAKPTRKDRRKFYRLALSSLRESQCILQLIGNSNLAKEADILGAHLFKLCKNT